MNRWRISILFFLGFLVVGLEVREARAEGVLFKGESKAQEKTINGQWIREVTNQKYDFYDDSRRQAPTIHLLLSQRFEVTTREATEGSQGRIHIEVYQGEQGQYSKLLWKLDVVGHDGGIEDGLYKVTQYGCCDAETTYKYFSILKGNLLMKSTAELLTLEVPNTDLKRFFAYQSASSADELSERKLNADVIGVLTYASPEKTIQKLVIRDSANHGDNNYTPEKLELIVDTKPEATRHLTLWSSDQNSDSKGISKLKIKITLNSGGVIVIPIQQDAFDLAHASHPKAISLRFSNQ